MSFADCVTKIRVQMNAVGPNYIRSLHKLVPTSGECPNRRALRADFGKGIFNE